MCCLNLEIQIQEASYPTTVKQPVVFYGLKHSWRKYSLGIRYDKQHSIKLDKKLAKFPLGELMELFLTMKLLYYHVAHI